MIVAMNGRNGDGFGKGLAKLTLGAGIGFALYMMFGGRGGLGFGRGSGGLDAGGAGPGTAAPEAPAARMPDAQPIGVRVRPDPADPTKTSIELDGNLVSVAELIARIVGGGRRDVVVAVRGDTRQGGWEEIRQTLSSAGIQVIDQQAPRSASPRDPWA